MATSRTSIRRSNSLLGVIALTAIAHAELPKEGPLGKPASTSQAGFVPAAIPEDNPQTAAKISLGEKLFFEGRLSVDGSVSCATCHDPDKGFTDQRTTSEGLRGQHGTRNAPTILNAAFNELQFWDGRAHTLEDQAKLPLLDPIEMGQKSGADVVSALASYADEFQRAFGRAMNFDDVARALAAYERTQIATASRFDAFIAGKANVLTTAEKRGWQLFQAQCATCHPASSMFTDHAFHALGLPIKGLSFADLAEKGQKLVNSGDPTALDRAALETDMGELGRFLVTKQHADIGAFKTPTLRNLLVTQPYFHDGSQRTLWGVIAQINPKLSGSELDDLVAFLATLTSDRYEAAGKQELARQRALYKR